MSTGIVRSVKVQLQFCTDAELMTLKESIEKTIEDRALKGEKHF